jgi:hypothetical protein
MLSQGHFCYSDVGFVIHLASTRCVDFNVFVPLPLYDPRVMRHTIFFHTLHAFCVCLQYNSYYTILNFCMMVLEQGTGSS